MARRSMAVRKYPSFFKVLVGDFSNQLKIPPSFLVKIDGKLPQQPYFRSPAGAWRVNLEKVNDEFFFGNGWEEFVNDNGLKVKQFLVFQYAGNLGFYVDIYEKNGCRKEFVMADTKRDRPLEEGEHGYVIHRKRPKSKHVGSFTRQGKQNIDDQGLKGSADGIRTIQATSPIKIEVTDTKPETPMHPLPKSSGEATALQRANTSEKPFIKITMHRSYVNRSQMYLSSKFVNKYLIKKNSGATLRVLGGRTWPVKFRYQHAYLRSRGRFASGWREFVTGNSLEVGDVCVFTLISRTKFLLEVVIFRQREAANYALSQGNPRQRINSSRKINEKLINEVLESNCPMSWKLETCKFKEVQK